jgi:hypothetical protein
MNLTVASTTLTMKSVFSSEMLVKTHRTNSFTAQTTGYGRIKQGLSRGNGKLERNTEELKTDNTM